MAIIIEARVQQKTDSEEAWLANPLPILPGEAAYVISEGGQVLNFKINTYEVPKLFTELPYVILSSTIRSATFIVYYDSIELSTVERDVDGTIHYDSVVQDDRLIDATNYTVRTTQINNAAFRQDEVAYNSTDGTVTIFDFVLNEGQMIIVDAPGTAAANTNPGSMANVLSRLAILEQISKPFLDELALIWWTGEREEIPAGWEVVEKPGRVMVSQDVNDVDFETIGQQGGVKQNQLTIDNIPQHDHFTVVNDSYSGDDFPDVADRLISAFRSMILYWQKGSGGGKESTWLVSTTQNYIRPTLSPTSLTGKQTPDKLPIAMKYEVGVWIKFVGI